MLLCLFNLYAKMLGWKKHRLESRFPGEILITSDMQMTPPLCGKPTTYKCRDDCFFEVEVIIIIRGRDKESKTERNCDDTEVILSK